MAKEGGRRFLSGQIWEGELACKVDRRMEISAIIIAINEEKKISDCLESLSWVDEILVIDGGSKDKTVSISKKYGARVVDYREGKDFSDRRNKGMREAKGDWILYLDTDERVTPSLRDEILEVIKIHEFEAFAIPRRNFVLGSELKHGGMWPDYQKRLFRRDKLRGWKGELHEEPQFEGRLGHFKNSMIHLKHDKISEMVEKTNLWSNIEAKLMHDAGHPKMNIPRFGSAIFREFWLRMIKQGAFLDGAVGIIYGLYQVYSKFVSYAKLWEMQMK